MNSQPNDRRTYWHSDQIPANIVASLIAILLLLSIANGNSQLAAQTAGETAENTIAWKAREKALQAEFNRAATALKNSLGPNQQTELRTEIERWIRQVDVHRQYIFIPTSNSLPLVSNAKPSDSVNEFRKLRIAHSGKLFDLAKETASTNAAASFQLINQVVAFNPDHEEARRILGHRKQDDGWRIAAGRLRPKLATRDFDLLNWSGKSYLRVRTDHFDIYSKATETQTIELAKNLERWYGVWRQVFFEYWSRGSTLQRWLDGKSSLRPSSKKFRVVFFKDREQYSAELEPKVPGISVSLGYYDDRSETSFFYAGNDQQTADTWRHEATHQWFSESIRTKKGTFEQQDIWLGEGIAMYFESLADFGNYVTLGGFDARRLQYARIRRLRDKFYVPFAQLRSINRRTLQQQPELKKLYSQAAGVTQFLMDSDGGKHQASLIEYIELLYRGKLKPDTFEKILGLSNEDIDANYPRFLAFQGAQFQYIRDHGQTEFAFPYFKLNVRDFQAMGRCKRLDWIDLTGVSIGENDLAHLKACLKLRELYLASTNLHGSALAPIAQLRDLKMLDLSGSNATSRTIRKLKGSRLTELRLTATPIDDSVIETLADLTTLQKLDVRQTRLSSSAIRRLQTANPQLEISQ